MEDVLDVYKRPYDPLRPVVCVDETNRQLIEERSIPAKPGNPELVDYEYRRCGVADLFVAFEPLAPKRVVSVTETRKAADCAMFIKKLADIHYAHAEKLVLVWDNLNIHAISSLYKAFPPAEARRITKKLEIHHTPIHASWLNMVEIEIGVLSRQCLAENMTSMQSFCLAVAQKYQRFHCELEVYHKQCQNQAEKALSSFSRFLTWRTTSAFRDIAKQWIRQDGGKFEGKRISRHGHQGRKGFQRQVVKGRHHRAG